MGAARVGCAAGFRSSEESPEVDDPLRRPALGRAPGFLSSESVEFDDKDQDEEVGSLGDEPEDDDTKDAM